VAKAALCGAALFGVAAACTLAVSVDGLTGGASDGGVDAPGVPEAAPGTPEAGLDAAVEASDAIAATDACDADFCDDFDDGPLGARWSRVVHSDGGSIALDTTAFRSPPNSLLTSLGDGGAEAAYLQLDLGAAKLVKCRMNVFVLATGSTSLLDFFTLDVSGPQTYSLKAAFTPTASSLRDDVFLPDGGCLCPREEPKGPLIPLSQWVAVEVEVDFSKATLRANGVTLATETLLESTPTAVTMKVGQYSYGANPWTMRFDDLSCTLSR